LLADNSETLSLIAGDFADQPSIAKLETLRENLNLTRTRWQAIAPFQFGPSKDFVLRSSLNTYPADIGKIESNITSQDYTLGSPTNIGAEGFPAIEYLIYGNDLSDQEVVDLFLDDQAQHRHEYLRALCSQIELLSKSVSDSWSNSYGAAFVSDGALGTDVGSSLSLLVNAYEFHLQRFLRDGKVGIPAGVRSAGVPRPMATEAFYSGRSVEYLVVALKQMKVIYTGDAILDGYGLYDYLLELDFDDLGNEIVLQMDETIAAAQALQDPLSVQIETDNDKVLDVFLAIQKLVPMIKSDMASAMGVIITNQDADGD
jgi:predicted lipoprotein